MLGWFDLSTLKEPYRLEGKKTMGLELAEQLDWRMPDVLLYPTGGGTGLVGIPKGYEELRAMGWLSGALPRFFAVQAEGCAPVVKAFRLGRRDDDGLGESDDPRGRAPGAVAVRRAPDAAAPARDGRRRGGGRARRQIEEAQRLLARLEGIWTAPESAALVAALARLKDGGAGRRATPRHHADPHRRRAQVRAAASSPPPTDLAGTDEEIIARVRRAVGA